MSLALGVLVYRQTTSLHVLHHNVRSCGLGHDSLSHTQTGGVEAKRR